MVKRRCLFETVVSHPLKYNEGFYLLHMHRIETEHVRVVCESQQVIFFPVVICFSGEEKIICLVSRLHHTPCCWWVHLLCMDTPKDATQYSLCVRASSVSVFLQPQIKCEVLSHHLRYGRGAVPRTLTG